MKAAHRDMLIAYWMLFDELSPDGEMKIEETRAISSAKERDTPPPAKE